MFAAVHVAYRHGEKLTALTETTQEFESTIDHNHLAELIGKAIVRAINSARNRGADISDVRFEVLIETRLPF